MSLKRVDYLFKKCINAITVIKGFNCCEFQIMMDHLTISKFFSQEVEFFYSTSNNNYRITTIPHEIIDKQFQDTSIIYENKDSNFFFFVSLLNYLFKINCEKLSCTEKSKQVSFSENEKQLLKESLKKCILDIESCFNDFSNSQPGPSNVQNEPNKEN